MKSVVVSVGVKEKAATEGGGRMCWFCHRSLTGVRSPEHVFPLWLQEELGLGKVLISPTWHDQPLGKLLDQRQHTWGSLVAGRICSVCNNGWMSGLESEAIPVLKPLLRGEGSINSLSMEERSLIAVWAVKTFLALSAAVQEPRAPREQYRALYADPRIVPDGIYVFADQREVSDGAHYTIDATWQMSRPAPDEDAARRVQQSSYKACLQLGRLLLLVVWWPLGHQWILDCEEGAYDVIFPPKPELVWHPAPAEFPEEVRQVATEEELQALDFESGLVCIGLTLSVRVFHREDLTDDVRDVFGIRAPAS